MPWSSTSLASQLPFVTITCSFCQELIDLKVMLMVSFASLQEIALAIQIERFHYDIWFILE